MFSHNTEYEEYHNLPTNYYSTRDTSYLDRLIYKAPTMGSSNVALIIAFIIIGVVLSAGMFAFLGDDPENIPPLIFGCLIVMTFVFMPLIVARSKVKSIEIQPEGLLIRTSITKSFTIGFNEFEQIQPFRHYGKYGAYTSTSYQIVHYVNGKKKKLNLFDMNPLQGSELIHEIYKAYIIYKNGSYADYNVDLSMLNREFTWNTEPSSITNANSKKKNTLSYIIIGIITAIPPLVVIIAMISHYGISPIAIVVTIALIAFIGLMIFLSIASSKRADFYSSSTINRLAINGEVLTVDSLAYRRNDIESVQISRPSIGDPKSGGNTVLLIITRNRLYKYETYVVNESSRNTLRKLKTNPAWSYQDFYYSIYNWCKANNVKVMDYII